MPDSARAAASRVQCGILPTSMRHSFREYPKPPGSVRIAVAWVFEMAPIKTLLIRKRFHSSSKGTAASLAESQDRCYTQVDATAGEGGDLPFPFPSLPARHAGPASRSAPSRARAVSSIRRNFHAWQSPSTAPLPYSGIPDRNLRSERLLVATSGTADSPWWLSGSLETGPRPCLPPPLPASCRGLTEPSGGA